MDFSRTLKSISPRQGVLTTRLLLGEDKAAPAVVFGLLAAMKRK
jgi:hypothetical protein